MSTTTKYNGECNGRNSPSVNNNKDPVFYRVQFNGWNTFLRRMICAWWYIPVIWALERLKQEDELHSETLVSKLSNNNNKKFSRNLRSILQAIYKKELKTTCYVKWKRFTHLGRIGRQLVFKISWTLFHYISHHSTSRNFLLNRASTAVHTWFYTSASFLSIVMCFRYLHQRNKERNEAFFVTLA